MSSPPSPQLRFNGAFSTQAYDSDPPGETPLLTHHLRIVLVPTTHSIANASHQQQNTTNLNNLPPNTLIELRTTPSTLYFSIPITPSTSFTSLENNAFHISTLYDLLLLLPSLTASQIASIRILKLRWYTAACLLWQNYHLDHASQVSSTAIEALSGLEKIVVECEGREAWMVEGMKEDLELCLGEAGIGIEMVGGKEVGYWGGASWGFGRLGG